MPRLKTAPEHGDDDDYDGTIDLSALLDEHGFETGGNDTASEINMRREDLDSSENAAGNSESPNSIATQFSRQRS